MQLPHPIYTSIRNIDGIEITILASSQGFIIADDRAGIKKLVTRGGGSRIPFGGAGKGIESVHPEKRGHIQRIVIKGGTCTYRVTGIDAVPFQGAGGRIKSMHLAIKTCRIYSCSAIVHHKTGPYIPVDRWDDTIPL